MYDSNHISAFDALVTELHSIENQMQERSSLAKSLANYQAFGAKQLAKLKDLAKSFGAAAHKAKLDAAHERRERAEALLKSANTALNSGKLDPYRKDILKQKIAELERRMKDGKK